MKEGEMATTGEFEVEFPSNLLAGIITAEVYEDGEAPSRILDIEDGWNVDIHWELTGPVFPMIDGTWHVDGYMESMGPGDEFELPNEPAPISVNPNPTHKYDAHFHIPAGTVNPAPGENDIVYKLVVTVTYFNTWGVPGPMAGFVEVPMLHFYKDLQTP
jgi:hypothetical protein